MHRAGPAAIEELVCLREALSRRIRGRVPPAEAEETWARLQMTIDRAMACAARRAFSQLEQAACFDALTGVLNRRSFQLDARSDDDLDGEPVLPDPARAEAFAELRAASPGAEQPGLGEKRSE